LSGSASPRGGGGGGSSQSVWVGRVLTHTVSSERRGGAGMAGGRPRVRGGSGERKVVGSLIPGSKEGTKEGRKEEG